ncbi:UNKNOWN [Stylonychia lemnae]|uniref:Uncharacterized protein n=1 Tax=Stylonychia lemnae TaxID=5949 RepID=A0A077ZV01_STYLE|nr:UNKNOWN [Stylonychia lemnae]|eukprot:CDW73714.1 UNKNOWN [Stylonychia lemnae]
MNEARQKKLSEYGQNNIFGQSKQNKNNTQRAYNNQNNWENRSMMSMNSSRYNDFSDTTSVYSLATSVTSFGQMSQSTSMSKRDPNMTQEERLKRDFDRYQRHLARKYQRQVEKQRQKLFGQSEIAMGQKGGTQIKNINLHNRDSAQKQVRSSEVKLSTDNLNKLSTTQNIQNMQLRQTNGRNQFSKTQNLVIPKVQGNLSVHSGFSQRSNSGHLSSADRKMNNLTSNLFKENQDKSNRASDVKLEKAQLATIANWKNALNNKKTYTAPKVVKIDPFKERQKMLSSNVFEGSRDYSHHQPSSRKFIDYDNLYDQKRMNDPMYSDLFDQCMNTGGRKPSPIRKKFDEIGFTQQDWTHQDLQQKMKRDYSDYKPRDQMLKEFKGTINPLKVVKIDLN